MESRIEELASAIEIENPQQLVYAAKISWPTAKNVWAGDLSNTRASTLLKIARALKCTIDDLFRESGE